MADVFVSYVSEDRAIAEKISRGLEGAGFSVWWDRHIHGGVGFRKEIDRQLGAAKVVVVLWSAASLDSEWVCDEAQQALDENKLIPLRLDGVQPPLGFRQAQSLDFSDWNGDPNGRCLRRPGRFGAAFRWPSADGRAARGPSDRCAKARSFPWNKDDRRRRRRPLACARLLRRRQVLAVEAGRHRPTRCGSRADDRARCDGDFGEVHRGPAVHRHEREEGPGIPRGRDGGRDHQSACQGSRPARPGADLVVLFQGQANEDPRHRARTRRRARSRRQHPARPAITCA